ncbi:hypothetical protein [Listeria fleischmannii]|nr:hypothetical protein [Listeria fleischmannii]STY35812.1 Uncharacterised protein [Listeria fleischmannii subsp. coloradonensis]
MKRDTFIFAEKNGLSLEAELITGDRPILKPSFISTVAVFYTEKKTI